MPTEEQLKYAICQVAYKSSNNPQFPKYQKLYPRKERRVLRNNYEQTGPLINYIAEIGTFAQNAKTIYHVLPEDIRKSENYSKFKFINNTKRYFHDMVLARCMATRLL